MKEISEETRRIRDYKNRDKHAEAEALIAVRKTRSDEQQITELDRRLGTNVGAKKERKKLA